ncbi:hypothetical protein LguiA_007136 [Lonicera macranthoides]
MVWVLDVGYRNMCFDGLYKLVQKFKSFNICGFGICLFTLIKERDAEINRRIEEVMMTMRASIRDEVLTELRGGNGPSSIDNVPTSSSIHRPDLDID